MVAQASENGNDVELKVINATDKSDDNPSQAEPKGDDIWLLRGCVNYQANVPIKIYFSCRNG